MLPVDTFLCMLSLPLHHPLSSNPCSAMPTRPCPLHISHTMFWRVLDNSTHSPYWSPLSIALSPICLALFYPALSYSAMLIIFSTLSHLIILFPALPSLSCPSLSSPAIPYPFLLFHVTPDPPCPYPAIPCPRHPTLPHTLPTPLHPFQAHFYPLQSVPLLVIPPSCVPTYCRLPCLLPTQLFF